MGKFENQIEKLSRLNCANMYSKDFLLTSEKSLEDLNSVFAAAEALRALREQNISTSIFHSGLGVSLIRSSSTRTHVSFASACDLLGLSVYNFDEDRLNSLSGESLCEIANIISNMTEVIGIRDNQYVGQGNNYMREIADAVSYGFDNGVLEQRPSVINLQCDIDHPTQTMSDMLYLINEFGGVENLKGKKMAISWAYSPSQAKPLSVTQGLISLMTRFGMNVVLAHPEGYDVMPEIEENAKKQASASGGSFVKTDNMEDAFSGADIVYAKNWAPYEMMQRRSDMYLSDDFDGIKVLERELMSQNKQYKSWTCTENLMNMTRSGNGIYMHCFPSNVTDISCKSGEVSKDVFEKSRLRLYKQSACRPYIIAAMILLARSKDPVQTLEILKNNAAPRIISK